VKRPPPKPSDPKPLYQCTPWDPAKLASYDVRKHVPPEVVEAVNTPHEHEGPKNKPVWLIWLIIDVRVIIDCVCSTPDSAVYHYGALVEKHAGYIREGKVRTHLERIPMDHAFGSSLDPRVIMGGGTPNIRAKLRRVREGD
jgi:hypothetical protein